MYYGGIQVYIQLNNVMKIYISFLHDSWYTLMALVNAKSYKIHGCAEKLCGKNWCHLFYFMFVEIQYVSTCAVAIGGESVANHAISHCKKMAKVRVSFSAIR